MPLTADLGGKNYTLGRGRIFFDRFAPNVVVGATTRGDGERYLGNTPEFALTSESEDLEHFDSDSGVRVKDDSVQLSLDRSASFTCDNIDAENIALFFLGTTSTVTQAGATGVVEVMTDAKRGRFYQLGVSESTPSGVRNVTNVVIKKGGAPTWGTTVTASGNYEVDEVRGRIYVEADSVDIDEDDIQITYDVDASTREQVISKSDSIYGSLRFVADNPKGPNRDYFLPYVKLAPDGDYQLKGDEWQQIGFTVEILKKSSNVDAIYIDGQGVVTP
jgi:hypothetical protein